MPFSASCEGFSRCVKTQDLQPPGTFLGCNGPLRLACGGASEPRAMERPAMERAPGGRVAPAAVELFGVGIELFGPVVNSALARLLAARADEQAPNWSTPIKEADASAPSSS